MPPTLDILIPRYLIVFIDCIGRRKQLYRENASWHALERAVVMSTSYWRSDHDLSPLVTFINDNKFDAIYVIGSIIPKCNISIIDNNTSTAPYKIDDLKFYSNNFHMAFNIIKANKDNDKPIFGICEQNTRGEILWGPIFENCTTDWLATH